MSVLAPLLNVGFILAIFIPEVLVGCGIGGRWEMDSQKWCEVGNWSHKQVGDGRLAPKTGGRWEVDALSHTLEWGNTAPPDASCTQNIKL